MYGLDYDCFYNVAICSNVLYAVIVCCIVCITQQALIFNLELSSNTPFYLFHADFIEPITINERKEAILRGTLLFQFFYILNDIAICMSI